MFHKLQALEWWPPIAIGRYGSCIPACANVSPFSQVPLFLVQQHRLRVLNSTVWPFNFATGFHNSIN